MDYPKSVPNVGLVNGKFVDEDTVAGVVGSLIPSAWGNAVTDEIIAVVKEAGLNPAEGNNVQLLAAIKTMIGRVSGIVGQSLNLKASVAAASVTCAWTADELIVESALGGLRYCLSNFNKSLTLNAANGVGGMDTGAAPVSGYVGVYAIYNPTTGVSELLGVNAASLIAEVYAGANMPPGFTASALISVWPTNASGQLVPGQQRNREIARTAGVTVLSGSSLSPTFNPITISSAVPQNAKSVSGVLALQANSGSGGLSINVASDSAGTGAQGTNGSATTSNGISAGFQGLAIATIQLTYFNGLANGPTAYTNTVVINKYLI